MAINSVHKLMAPKFLTARQLYKFQAYMKQTIQKIHLDV